MMIHFKVENLKKKSFGKQLTAVTFGERDWSREGWNHLLFIALSFCVV
jgi:hypothetical protein